MSSIKGGGLPMYGSEAVVKHMEHWKAKEAAENDQFEKLVHASCQALGEKLVHRLKGILGDHKLSLGRFDPMIRIVEDSARQLSKESGNVDGLMGSLIVQVAVLRFDLLQQEEKLRLSKK